MIDEQKLRERLAGRLVGQSVICLKTVGSTNEHAFGLANTGAPEGTVVLADEQRKGKGRLQRVWQSPPGLNIYTSVILRPPFKPSVAPRITLTVGVAVADLLSRRGLTGVTLKWPNDVLIGGRKACGILTEMKAAADRVDFVVVGIGLNVNMRMEDFGEEILDRATSLREETGRHVPREELAAQLYHRLEKWYKVLLEEGFDPVRERWLAFAGILGKKIRAGRGADEEPGEVVGVDDDGALLIRDERGLRRRVVTGDIIVERG
ncbi:MAG TPA: biotin--[acetyl-CoA-carboxylase] ligase [Syntrophales bacterium]|nr:biotin--[acetyl-CoA-carboxylase] ligase [Syntrophales bacterium]HPI57186.1 biotin--[acetyl-CoA-carboxylase] ligase [Syntrophales bacterium]HPN23430.1 biotin--[acetyl-CoA-carboxylase] ligase [Syntrophales bacterium]HQM28045.1 biotin--[acetyl-CoA-carboxylase] ligase [Syntrophales bacterium]